jgi:hypothetical protein
MDTEIADLFTSRWRTYFAGAELPICCYYADQVREEDSRESTHEQRCLIGNLNRVRDGFPFVYDARTPGCAGGKRYSGFTQTLRSNFEYFLSCGIPGEVQGERYKQTPELVKAYLDSHPPFRAPGKYLVFKRWDRLAADEQPLVVIFFATADVLAGLFTLANYDWADPYGVIAPMGSGCASILQYPIAEADKTQSRPPRAGFGKPVSGAPPGEITGGQRWVGGQSRCVLGMFDVSARPHVPGDTLTFAVPMRRFEQMVRNMDESFLITKSWRTVRSRLG